MLEHTSLTQEEHSQIVQTIEMFEVITQTQPDDYQSLEILKDAYGKIGRADDSLKASRRLAEAYFNAGSYTLAMQECEVILQKEPNAPEILAMLGDIEARGQGAGQQAATTGPHAGLVEAPQMHGLIAKVSANGNGTSAGKGGGLIDLQHTRMNPQLQDRGDEHLAKFLVMQQLFSEEQVTVAAERTKEANTNLSGQDLASSLLENVSDNSEKLDAALSQLIDRTKFAYVPLEYYDLDRQIARMLPDYLTLGRLFVPFDLISRTVMVACCNPFDAAGRDAVQQSLDYTVTWYLARPASIMKALQDIYRLESRA